MPELLTNEQQQPLHLPADRRDMILQIRRELAELGDERKAINERIKSTKHRLIKGALGWTMKQWDILGYVDSLELDDRTQFFANLREGFSALQIGEQLDWITATGADREEKSKTDNGAAAGTAAGFTAQMGYEAGLEGKNADSNPHVEDSIQARVWHENWLKGQAEIVRRFASGEPAISPPPPRRSGRPRKDLH